MDYKARHEEFVSGLTGSSLGEIYKVFGLVMVSYVSWGLVMNKLPQDHWVTVRSLDFFYLWIAPMLSVTIYSAKPLQFALLLVGPPILQRIIFSKAKSETAKKDAKKGAQKAAQKAAQKTKKDSKDSKDPQDSIEVLGHVGFLTAYRSLMLIMTMAAILAVDFSVFPRKYAKAETWGASVMDLGVGSFVFSNGIVSARPILQHGISGKKLAGWKQSLHLSGEILALGVLRLIGVKLLNYQEHVTEYGVHWNFFITLGVLPLVLPFFQFVGKYVPMIFLGGVVGIVYEVLLKNTGLLEWVLTAERTSLLSQNKEGLCSTIGFVAIFLVGQGAGYFVLPNCHQRNAQFPPRSPADVGKVEDVTTIKIKNLFLYGVAYEIAFRIFKTETQISRRLANLPYILWVCSFNLMLVGVFALVSLKLTHKVSESMRKVNSRGQTMFLVSNVATGLTNMAVNTIDATPLKSVSVLSAYLALLYGVALYL